MANIKQERASCHQGYDVYGQQSVRIVSLLTVDSIITKALVKLVCTSIRKRNLLNFI